ncbi:hypothetical protein BH09SUM1_BH09SUM1_19380 [soil metagenome]
MKTRFGAVAVVGLAMVLAAGQAGAAPKVSGKPNFAPAEVNVPPAPKTPLTTLIAKGNPVGTAPRKVAGALSGRIVYCSAGHGWTFQNGATNSWATQRGDDIAGAADMVEDLGNVDQLAFFAQYCLNAGAIVVPFRPIGVQNNEVVIDNDDAQVTFLPSSGAWSTSGSTRFYGTAGDVPYRFAATTTGAATASAVYDASTLITQSGDYPVYVWVRAGSDRIDQEFIVTYSGGQASRRVNCRWTGGFWVYIGTYYFAAGGPASVTITNQQLAGDPVAASPVVIADAVRFGNGMGSINRGLGVSGHPRQEECSKYWVMAGIGQGATVTYGSGSDDQSDNVGTPPRTAAYMNAESTDWANAGNREDRIYLSFHSNSSGSGSTDNSARGGEGLYCSDTTSTTTPNANCTTNQYAYGALIGREINEALYARSTAPASPYELVWSTKGQTGRSDNTHRGGSGSAGINSYGEMSFSATSNEFDATIAEVAFHDNSSDTKMMRDPKVRDAIARASLHAMVKYFNLYDAGPTAYLPTAPDSPYVTSDAGGNLTLHWVAGPSGTYNGDAPTGYVIYVSTDGKGYGFAQSVSGVGTLSADVTSYVPVGQARYFRVGATNPGGESFPSVSVGALRSAGHANTLIVNGFDRFDRTLDPKQTAYLGGGTSDLNTFDRVNPNLSNSFNYVPVLGASVAAHGTAFDSCQNENITVGDVALSGYGNVLWILGEESTANETFSTAEQTAVTNYVNGGGNFFVSGSEIAWDLDHLGSEGDKSFIGSTLHVTYLGDDAGTYNAAGSAGGIFAGQSLTFDNGTGGAYDVDSPDQLTTGPGATVAMTYTGGSGGNAAVIYDGTPALHGKVVVLAFPLEVITTAAARNALMDAVLVYFGNSTASVPPTAWKTY